MGQLLSSHGVAYSKASSSTFNVFEARSPSSCPVEQIPKEQLENGREADHLNGRSDRLKNEGEANQLNNGGEADLLKKGEEAVETVVRDAVAALNKEELLEEEKEEGDCGFCLWLKGGGCKGVFVEWEKCLAEAEKNKEDLVKKCYQITADLTNCMKAHAGYYDPFLKARKTMEE